MPRSFTLPGSESAGDAAARLRRLEDIEAIRALIASYGPLADGGDAAGVAALFTPDGVYEVAGWGTLGGADLVKVIDNDGHRAWMAQGVAHVLSAPVIELDGDRATARNHSVVFLREPDGGYRAARAGANRWELVRTGEGWRVARRVNRQLDGSEAAWALFAVPE